MNIIKIKHGIQKKKIGNMINYETILKTRMANKLRGTNNYET